MTPQRGKKTSGKVPALVLLFLLIVALLGYLSLMNQIHTKISSGSSTNDHSALSSSEIHQLRERIHYLETKVDSYLAYASDPFMSMKTPATCEETIAIKKIACPDPSKPCELDTSLICMHDFPFLIDDGTSARSVGAKTRKGKMRNCVVYDFGIRESPEYGLAFTQQCDVVGFDPSPISKEWWRKSQESIQKEHPTYKFWDVGAGGIDGEIVLREYNWGQVSIIEFPMRVINTTNCNESGNCKFHFHDRQKTFKIPVRTLKTIMKELNHDRVHLLKLDVEGSEYAFLEKAIDDLSCRMIDQLSLEWHHYDYDIRYGVTSNPQINVLVALLKERCGLEQYWIHESRGWPSNEKLYSDMGMTLYYTLSSFKRTKWKF